VQAHCEATTAQCRAKLGRIQRDLLGNVGVSSAVRDGVDNEDEGLLVQLGHPRAPEVMGGPVVL
jgi:hypothetical protein